MSASCSLDELARFLRLAWIWGILMAGSGLNATGIRAKPGPGGAIHGYRE